ncbi:MAG TPA: excinuclease ABC subunit UvrB [Aggregatilineales bacterium]|nr:excinuclease ABC subunit UvrB [Aggregatilineales bacterium]
MNHFKLVADYAPTGDQPEAIRGLVDGLSQGYQHQTLLGATGTGKTFVIANIVEQINRPTLVIAHNKTLAAQLYSEFKSFFPHNAVEYFVSYYDYYQPEAYVPRHDLYIEKEATINEEIDRLRLAATTAVLSRHDVLVVASVSCIYGIGDPNTWGRSKLYVRRGEVTRRNNILRQLANIQYTRNDFELGRGTFRVRGDTMEIMPGYSSEVYRLSLWGDEVERITAVDPMTGEVLDDLDELVIYPAKQFIAEDERLGDAIEGIERELELRLQYLRDREMLLEAQRLEQRTRYDLEMLREVGYCAGIENYSRHLDGRAPGTPPWTLMDYFPDDFLLVIDESHMTIPQIRGMYHGDRSRKETLVDFGFRLPSAMDNRPLSFDEFQQRINQVIYTTATPGPYELEHSAQIVEQIIRPTGLVDPEVEVRPVEGQVDDLLGEINRRTERGERVLVTTLTKKMAEKLSDYLMEMGAKVHYLHSEVETIQRIEILRDLRLGVYDVIVGINLLREGLDLPEVSLVAILDADKTGFLRSETALIQTIGRAARHINGKAIMYADVVSEAMQAAIDETNRRRAKQIAYNEEHGIEPTSIVKAIHDLTERVRSEAKEREERESVEALQGLPGDELEQIIVELEKQMKQAAADLEFEKAALLRDQVYELRELLVLQTTGRRDVPIWEQDRVMPVADIPDEAL